MGAQTDRELATFAFHRYIASVNPAYGNADDGVGTLTADGHGTLGRHPFKRVELAVKLETYLHEIFEADGLARSHLGVSLRQRREGLVDSLELLGLIGVPTLEQR